MCGSLYEFKEQMDCYQPGVSGLEYASYGCYCGLYNRGHPIDPVDSCCYLHDSCYDRADKKFGITEPSIGLPISYIYTYRMQCDREQHRSDIHFPPFESKIDQRSNEDM